MATTRRWVEPAPAGVVPPPAPGIVTPPVPDARPAPSVPAPSVPAPAAPAPPVSAPPVPAPPLPGVPDADGLDEATLVVRAQEGDVRAFETLARRHQAVLYRLAVRVTGDPAEAEDALQESLLDAWRQIGRFRGDSSFTSWMYRVVTNRCLSQLRRRRPVPVDRVDETTAAPDSPALAAELDAELAALGLAVAGLPDTLRVCWVLRELEGLRYAEIAELTGSSEDAVRGRIHRARLRLAEVMRPWR